MSFATAENDMYMCLGGEGEREWVVWGGGGSLLSHWEVLQGRADRQAGTLYTASLSVRH